MSHEVPGISSRRSACDKCRFSKARCQRKRREQARCDRCSHTNSDCITSPVFRMRNWHPQPVDDTFQASRIERGDKRRRRIISKDHNISTSLPTSNILDLPNFVEDQCVHTGEVLHQALGYLRSLSPTEPLDRSEDALDFFDDFLEMNSSEAVLTSMPPSPPRPEPIPSLLSFTTPNSESLCQTADVSSQGCPSWTFEDDALFSNANVDPDVEQTPMQKISKLDYELVTISAQLKHATPTEAARTNSQASESSTIPAIMERTLNGTTNFVSTLKLLVEPDPARSRVGPVTSREITGAGVGNMRCVSVSSGGSDYDSSTDLEAFHTIDSQKDSRGPNCDQMLCQELDMSSVLAILAVYTRFLKLYSAIFTRIYQDLLSLSDSDETHVRLMSVPSLGNLPIQSGNLQTVVFMEVVTTLFETMDVLLGIPKEFRISKHRRTRRGLLNAPEFSDVTTSILSKASNTMPESREVSTRAIRKQIAKLRRLLRERFAP